MQSKADAPTEVISLVPEPPPRRRGRTKWLIGGLVLIVVAGGATVLVVRHRPGGEPVAQESGQVETVKLERRDLSTTKELDGSIGFGTARPLEGHAAGTVTWLPAVGATIKRGQQLFRADDKPVTLFYGSMPLFRAIAGRNLVGRDVRIVVDNLKALGYDVGHQPAPGEKVTPPAAGATSEGTAAAGDGTGSDTAGGGKSTTGGATDSGTGGGAATSGNATSGGTASGTTVGSGNTNGAKATGGTEATGASSGGGIGAVATGVNGGSASGVNGGSASGGTAATGTNGGSGASGGAAASGANGGGVGGGAAGVKVTVKDGEGVLTVGLGKAIKKWQEAVGLPITGEIGMGDVEVMAGAVRVEAVAVQPGAAADVQLMTITPTRRVITVEAALSEAAALRRGDKVTVTLPDDRTVKARILDVGRTPVAAEGGVADAEPKLTVSVTVDDPKTIGSLDGGDVSVNVAGRTAEGVLAAPIEALIALSEGGYAVQGPGGLVAVTTGMFADGFVEITGDGLTEGMDLVVAS